eukprot:15238790-Alexandrium_andersonii.AAC.1
MSFEPAGLSPRPRALRHAPPVRIPHRRGRGAAACPTARAAKCESAPVRAASPLQWAVQSGGEQRKDRAESQRAE